MQRLVGLLLLAIVAFCTPAIAQFNGCAPGICNTNPQTTNFPLPGIVPNGLDCYLSRGLYYPSQAGCTLTVSRASAGTAVDSNGNWSQFGNNVLRLTNLGATIEEARTNGIPNNTMQGAIVGTPGTLPNNWSIGGQLTGLSSSVVSIGVINGINTVAIRIFGTTGATNDAPTIITEAATQISATYGTTQTASALLALGGGSFTNVSNCTQQLSERNGAGTLVNTTTSTDFSTLLSPSMQRFQYSATLSNTATAFIRSQYQCVIPSSGMSVDYTLVFGWPQLENNSLINSSVASAVVASGGTCTPGTYTFTLSGGTGTQGTISGTVTGTALSGALTVVTPGSYTVLPPSPATLTGGTCTVQPTVTLTPTNNAAMGFATTPILTTNAAVARAADVPSLPLVACSAPWLYAAGTPAAPLNYSTNQVALSLNDGTNTNRFQVHRAAAGAGPTMFVAASGVTQTVGASPAGSWGQNALGKIASFIAASGSQLAFDGVAGTAGGALSVPATTQLNVGSRGNGDTQFNGVISRFAYGCGMPQIPSITNLNQWNYLLRRDLGGPANDNRPMWLREAA